jgi:Sugar phosphate permease
MHLLIGLGTSATFGPLMADTSQWFTRRRGIAVAIVSSGNYIGGVIWPPLLQHFVSAEGWRTTHIVVGVVCALGMLPFVPMLRRRAPRVGGAATDALHVTAQTAAGLSPNVLQAMLCVAGVACCVAMAMPQVPYRRLLRRSRLWRGARRRDALGDARIRHLQPCRSGFIADRIGGVATLLLGSVLQGVALFLYLLFDGLDSLYVISALFGLFQGGIVPMYAIIVRQYFSPREAATRVGLVLLATLLGMALGGWMSGALFDLTGSYRAAFVNGLIWNLLNVSIALWLLMRTAGGPRMGEARLKHARL